MKLTPQTDQELTQGHLRDLAPAVSEGAV